MNILILATWFPPDTAVAAVRPYMFAKYLTAMGHNVVVLRSGAFYKMPDNSYEPLPIRIISYLGEDSPAEVYKHTGTYEEKPKGTGKTRYSFIPKWLMNPLRNYYYKKTAFKRTYNFSLMHFEKIKAALDAMSGEHFDIVFSTFGEMPNLWGGAYAAKLFGCKYIQDFRDAIVAKGRHHGSEYRKRKRINEQALNSADAYTITSEDVAQELNKISNNHVYTVYNGYDEIGTKDFERMVNNSKQLRFCYTGTIYPQDDFTPLFRAMRDLCTQEIASKNDFIIDYAGKDYAILVSQAEKYGMGDVVVNHGYVTRTEAYSLQKNADIYLVTRWNTKYDRGIISGKFYEGIRAKMPILTLISGDTPEAELKKINDKYNYGYCYEESNHKKSYEGLMDFLSSAVQAKKAGEPIAYNPVPQLFTDFRYDTLTQKLESIMLELVNKK